MNILLVYFTGTYNTLFLTNILANKLKNNGHYVEVKPIDYKLKFNSDKYDLIGVGYPLHYFNAPKIISKMLIKNKVKNKKIFIYKNGNSIESNASSLSIIKKLKKNEFINEYQFLMPSNINKPFDNDFISYLLNKNISYIDYIASNIDSKRNISYSFKDKLKTFFGKRKVNKVVNSMKRNIVDKSKCIRCRKCSMSCPTGNIKYDKMIHRIVFYDHCDACLRCVNFCPTDAISINALTKIKLDEMYVFNINNYNLTNINISENELYKKYKSYFDYIDSLK